MKYNQIRECDIVNGEGIGVALFVQGCRFRCKNCFNPETWDFNGGKEFTKEIKEKFIELIDRPYIQRISLLGGECLADENLDCMIDLLIELKERFSNKDIWMYTGYKWEDLLKDKKRMYAVNMVDILVDGQYEEDKYDYTLKWRGSSNQRVIDVQKSLIVLNGGVALWTD